MSIRILVVKPSSFGDIVHSFPALALLHKAQPDAELDFVVNLEFADLLDFSPFPVSRKIIFERKRLGKWNSFLPELRKLICALRQERYDYAIDLQGLFRSGFCIGAARAKKKIGFAAPREKSAALFYNHKIEIAPDHAIVRCAGLIQKLFPEIYGEIPTPELPVSERGRAALPPLEKPYVVLLQGTRWPTKRFPPEFFALVKRELQRRFPSLHFVAAGGAGERDEIAKIGTDVLNLAGKTSVPVLMELLRGSVAVIGNDSGPLHAAAALKKPTFGFYGSTDPELTGPRGEWCHTFAAEIPCRCCLQRFCPHGETFLSCWKLEPGEIAGKIAEEIGGLI